MTPLQRMRVERNMEYHQELANHHAKMAEEGEKRNGEQRDMSEQEQQAHDRAMDEANKLAEMHGEAAQMLRDVLGMDLDPVIVEDKTNRQVIRRLN